MPIPHLQVMVIQYQHCASKLLEGLVEGLKLFGLDVAKFLFVVFNASQKHCHEFLSWFMLHFQETIHAKTLFFEVTVYRIFG